MTPQPPSHALRQAIHDLAPIGGYLVDAATRLAEMRDLLPPRGPLTEEFRELVTVLSHLENAYRNADEALLARYTELDHHERIPHPLPLARQIPEGAGDTMQATRSGVSAPAIGNPGMRATA